MGGDPAPELGFLHPELHELVDGGAREALSERSYAGKRDEHRIVRSRPEALKLAVQDFQIVLDRGPDLGAEPDGVVGVVFAPFTSSRPFFVVMSLYRSFEASLRRRPS